ncbi:hypothetical protein HETIRDRAFT_443591 [Heterobasidion irregulare TC 32-1]|uniref:Uncharacterized protein n=1 Tax=Heterobasidion irregulare (strain TC 32-1) TaxID=747525 RepID=W4KIM5_HETIT|nr:uncharacterized protein HETIRDRAFT_443591 [Heterobasidion irregulare TC 32-1]ETW85708.1 hypothetical protein HETIRDRAFT_443591 [Heterobasidion irregulare TC 32-1]
MGMIKAWDLSRQGGDRPIWRSTLRDDLGYHRTRVNELMYGDGHLWTASSDETIQIYQYPPPPSSQKQPKPVPPITHPTGFRAVLPLPIHPQLDADAFPYLLGGSGDLIRVYDISSLEEPEFIREVEGHWHDVTHLRVWLRDRKEGKGKEVWIVSASLDGTIRKWRLADIVVPPKPVPEEKKEATIAVPPPKAGGAFEMTEEEERELAELMEDD